MPKPAAIIVPDHLVAECEAFAASLDKHIAFVQEAGRKIGVPECRLVVHDESKWGSEELLAYARNFHGDKGDPEGFQKAWRHHYTTNDHHWEFWVQGGIPRPMVPEAVAEMVADWMGASMAYTNSWDITPWFKKNFPKMRLHLYTKIRLIQVLQRAGYEEAASVVIEELWENKDG